MGLCKSVELKRKVNGSAVTLHPETSADLVKFSETESVADILKAILSELQDIKQYLYNGSVYKTDGNGNIVDDGSGSGVILIDKPFASSSPTPSMIDDGSEDDVKSLI